MASSKRERLIESAESLVQRDGYGAASVDRILAEAGTARMTLYNHFGGKDELLAEVVQRMNTEAFTAIHNAVTADRGPPRERLDRVIDLVLAHAESRGHRGCVFLRTAAEVSEPTAAVRAAAVSYYDKIESLIEAILKEGGVSRPDRVARQIVVVLAGAFSMGALRGSEPAVAAARETLAAIVATAMPES